MPKLGFIDVDRTLLIQDINNPKNHPIINQKLIKQLIDAGITDVYLFTSMDSTDVVNHLSNTSLNGEYINRGQLIKELEKQGLKVHGVITPMDPVYNDGLGKAYKSGKFAELYNAIEEGLGIDKKPLTTENYTEKEGFQENYDRAKEMSGLSPITIRRTEGTLRGLVRKLQCADLKTGKDAKGVMLYYALLEIDALRKAISAENQQLELIVIDDNIESLNNIKYVFDNVQNGKMPLLSSKEYSQLVKEEVEQYEQEKKLKESGNKIVMSEEDKKKTTETLPFKDEKIEVPSAIKNIKLTLFKVLTENDVRQNKTQSEEIGTLSLLLDSDVKSSPLVELIHQFAKEQTTVSSAAARVFKELNKLINESLPDSKLYAGFQKMGLQTCQLLENTVPSNEQIENYLKLITKAMQPGNKKLHILGFAMTIFQLIVELRADFRVNTRNDEHQSHATDIYRFANLCLPPLLTNENVYTPYYKVLALVKDLLKEGVKNSATRLKTYSELIEKIQQIPGAEKLVAKLQLAFIDEITLVMEKSKLLTSVQIENAKAILSELNYLITNNSLPTKENLILYQDVIEQTQALLWNPQKVSKLEREKYKELIGQLENVKGTEKLTAFLNLFCSCIKNDGVYAELASSMTKFLQMTKEPEIEQQNTTKAKGEVKFLFEGKPRNFGYGS